MWIAKPKEIGKDYNDILKEQGKMGVKSSIEQAIPYKDYADKSQAPFTTLKEKLLAIKDSSTSFVNDKTISQHVKNQQDINSIIVDKSYKNNDIDRAIDQPISNKFIKEFCHCICK